MHQWDVVRLQGLQSKPCGFESSQANHWLYTDWNKYCYWLAAYWFVQFITFPEMSDEKCLSVGIERNAPWPPFIPYLILSFFFHRNQVYIL